MIAPINLRNSIIKMIKEEINYHKEYGNGHIIAKMNSLVDVDIINMFYEASKNGVKIDLIVRGIFCLKPQVRGLSENINVVSIIDRFLEHSRIYYFKAGGRDKVYLSSVDWMPRNFYSRFEIAFPIYDPIIKEYVIKTVLKSAINDNIKSWVLMPDGIYVKKTPNW